MQFTVQLEGGPRRVNHAAVLLGDFIYSFGGYCSNENPPADSPIDIHALNTVSYRWERIRAINEKNLSEESSSRRPAYSNEVDDDEDSASDYSDALEVNDEEAEMESDGEMEEMGEDEDETQRNEDVPYQRYGHTVVAYRGKAYLWGGRNDEFGASSLLHEFDPRTRRWTVLRVSGMIPPARDGHSAVVHGNKMFLFGGFEEELQRFSQETYVFDFDTNAWAELFTFGEKPMWRDFHTAVAIDGIMYVFGGRSDQMGPFHSTRDVYDSTLRVLDLRTRKWSELATSGEVPGGRRSHSAWTFNGRMYIFGGFFGTQQQHFNDLFSFDPMTRIWKKEKPSGPEPCVRRRQCTVEVNGRVFLFGGTMPTVPASANSTQQQQPGLSDLDDLYVLDYSPSLYHLSARAVIGSRILTRYLYALPRDIRIDLEMMTKKNSISCNGRARGAAG